MITLAEHYNRQMQRILDLLLHIYTMLGTIAVDVALTVIAWELAISIYWTGWPQLVGWATFTTGSVYAVLMMLRIVKQIREDDWRHHTISEVGEKLLEMDHTIDERLQMIGRNVVGPWFGSDEASEPAAVHHV